RAGGMLMGTDDGAIHKMDVPINLSQRIALLLQAVQNPLPDARMTPAVETARDRPDFAVAFGQVAPRRTCAQNPEHPVDHRAVVVWRTTCRFGCGQERLQAFPLFVG